MATHDFGGEVSYATTLAGSYTTLGTVIIKDDAEEETTKEIPIPVIDQLDKITDYIPGTQDLGQVKLSVQYAATSYSTLRGHKRSRTTLYWKFENDDGDIWGPVRGFIARITRPKQGDDERQMYDLTIRLRPLATGEGSGAYIFTD